MVLHSPTSHYIESKFDFGDTIAESPVSHPAPPHHSVPSGSTTTPTVRVPADLPHRTRIPNDILSRWRSEEPSLVVKWQFDRDETSFVTLLQRHSRKIGSEIRRYKSARPQMPHDDTELDQVAKFAFLEAVEAFDLSRGVSLATFSAYHVRNALLRYGLDFQYPYRVGTNSNERKALYALLSLRTEKEKKAVSPVLTDTDIENVAQSTGASPTIVKDAALCLFHSRADVDNVAAGMADPRDADTIDREISHKKAISSAVSGLGNYDDKRTAILHGYLEFGEIDIPSLAVQFGVTQPRIRQLRDQVLSDLRQNLSKIGVGEEELSH